MAKRAGGAKALIAADIAAAIRGAAMADDVTDAMLIAATNAYWDAPGASSHGIRAAISAVAPLIRAAECATLRARVAELEGALRVVVSWELTEESYSNLGFDAGYVRDAFRTARAALKGAKP